MLGIDPWTLCRWVYAGEVPSIKSESGRVFIGHPVGAPTGWRVGRSLPAESSRAARYSRVSSLENKAALASQKDRLVRYATVKGWQVAHGVCE
jgi:Predicted site-specific integrase-resolvase